MKSLEIGHAGEIELPPVRFQTLNPFVRRVAPAPMLIDTTPIAGTLRELRPIDLQQVRRTADEPLFNSLMEQHHYLSYEQPVGEHLKCLVWAQGRPLACVAWSSAPRHLGSRDRYIGWSAEGRRRNIRFIAYNTRFLILPWVRIPHLASHILGRMVAVLLATGNACTDTPSTLRKPSSIPRAFAGPVIARPTGCCWDTPRAAARMTRRTARTAPLKKCSVTRCTNGSGSY